MYVTFEAFPVDLIQDIAASVYFTTGQIGLLVSGYVVVAAAVTIPTAALASRVSRKTALVASLQQLGHERFSVVGHDRGSYVAYRTALDHPRQVEKLAVLDCVPLVEALERADACFAELWWHWFFFATEQAERVITADPMAWYQPDARRMGQENYDDMVAAISSPATVQAMLEDYRAGPARRPQP